MNPIPVAELFGILALVLVGLLLALLLGRKKGDPAGRSAADPVTISESYTDCPLCGTSLPKGWTVHSVLYKGRESDRMEIWGCAWCWPSHPRAPEARSTPAPGGAGARRSCPSCGGPLAPEAFVTARVTRRPGKTHVHVLGCDRCRRS